MSNPFTFGKPVANPKYFAGRQTEIQQVVNRLLSSARESTSLVGERRMGKTSLLLHLSNSAVASRYGLTPDIFSLVYLDMQGTTDMVPQRFWQRVLKKLQTVATNPTAGCPAIAQSVESLLTQPSFDIFDLDDLFDTIALEGKQIILFLDEFESITQNVNFKVDFFGGLRSLAINKPLSLVTATQCDLEDLCHSEEIKSSPFFNIFATVVLRPFEPADVDQLFQKVLAEELDLFSNAEQALVASLGGGYPFFLQMAGYYLYEGKCSSLAHRELFQQVVEQFDLQSAPHFNYLWNACSESEKITLLVVHLLNQDPKTPRQPLTLEQVCKVYSRAETDMRQLFRRGLVVNGQQGYTLFSSRLGRWIAQELKAEYADDKGVTKVADWVKNYGLKEPDQAQVFLANFKSKYWPMLSVYVEQLSLGVARNVLYQTLVERWVQNVL